MTPKQRRIQRKLDEVGVSVLYYLLQALVYAIAGIGIIAVALIVAAVGIYITLQLREAV